MATDEELALEWELARKWEQAHQAKVQQASTPQGQANRAGDTLRTGERGFSDYAGQLASGAVEGLAQTGGFLGDVLSYATSPITGTDKPFGYYTQGMGDLARELTFMADEPTSTSERALRKAGEFAGAAAVPAGAAVKGGKIGTALMEQLAAQTGGWAAEGAAELGAGPVGQLLAGLIGGASPTALRSLPEVATRLAPGISNEGARRRAVKALTTFADDPELEHSIAKAVAKEGPFREYQTTAELMDSPGLTSMTDELAATEFATKASQARTARQQAREKVLDELIEEPRVTPKTVGTPLRRKVVKEEQLLRDKVNQAYAAVDPEGTTSIPIYSQKKEIQDVLEKQFRFDATPKAEGGRAAQELVDIGVSSGTQKLLRNVVYGPNKRTFKDLQIVRTRVNDLLDTIKDPGEKRVLMTLKTGIDDAEKAAAKTGEGFTRPQLLVLQNAQELATELGQRFEQGFGKAVMRGVKKGDPTTVDSKLLQKALTDERSMNQAIKAVGRDPESIKQLRSAVVQQIRKESVTANDQLSPAKFAKALDRYELQLEELYQPTHIKNLKGIAEDLYSGETRQIELARIGAQGQPTTQKRQSVATILGQASGATGNTYLGRLARALPIFKEFSMMNQRQVNDLLWQAAQDPKAAQLLLKAPNYANMKALGQQLMKDEAIAGFVASQQAAGGE